jgi:hypothetical protein
LGGADASQGNIDILSNADNGVAMNGCAIFFAQFIFIKQSIAVAW